MSASKLVQDVTSIFKFGNTTVQTKQFIGIALIIFGLLAFVFVSTLPHSHYNPEKESSSSSSSKTTTAKATKTTTPSKTKAKKEKEDTGSAPPTPKSSRKKAAPKVVEESPVASAKPRTRASSVKKGKRD